MASDSPLTKWRRRIRLRTRIGTGARKYRKQISDSISVRRATPWVRRDLAALSGPESIAMGYAGWKPGVGGVRNHLETIARHSSRDVHLLPSNESMGRTTGTSYRKAARPFLNQGMLEQASIVHSHVDPEFIQAAKRAKRRGSHWIHTYHLLYFPEAWEGYLRPWQEQINRALIEEARHAEVRISVADWLRDFLQSEHGIESITIPNGVDVARCEEAKASRFTSHHGIKDFIIFVSSMAPVKNPLLFVRLAEQFPELPFVMIGRDLLPAPLSACYGAPLPLNLFPIGPLPHHETLDAIAASAAMVMPSHFEGLPTALLEAMALGKTVVATDANGCRDAVGAENAGLLAEPGNLDSFSACLEEALGRPELGPNAARRIRERFDWRVVIPQIDRIYSELLGH